MRGRWRYILLSFIIFVVSKNTSGQEAFMDESTRNLLDSLDRRIAYLQSEMPRLSKSRSVDYFFKRNELDRSIFLSHYHRDLFDENLESAGELVQSRINACEKRNDSQSLEFYKSCQKALTYEIQNQQRRYQQLFAREKNFRKELDRFLKAGDEYSLRRARRMTDLAMKYASENGLEDVSRYLKNYSDFVDAAIYNHNSDYELAKLTRSASQFNKVFEPMVESDSLELIKAAGELVDQCYSYSKQTLSVLDSSFYALQRNVVATSISDYYSRKGTNASLESMGEQAIVARVDTLNREGIYKWEDKILVVGYFTPEAKFETVQSGEAIINADRKLIEYIRVNRLAKIGREVKIGPTYVIPYVNNTEAITFQYSPTVNKFQYMICYTRIESSYFTKEISKFLPPVQFEGEVQMN